MFMKLTKIMYKDNKKLEAHGHNYLDLWGRRKLENGHGNGNQFSKSCTCHTHVAHQAMVLLGLSGPFECFRPSWITVCIICVLLLRLLALNTLAPSFYILLLKKPDFYVIFQFFFGIDDSWYECWMNASEIPKRITVSEAYFVQTNLSFEDEASMMIDVPSHSRG